MRQVRHRERPTDAALVARPARVVFHPPEVGQHIVERPAAIAELRPHVEILDLAADIDHAVDRARAAKHASARQQMGVIAARRIRFAAKAPVDRAVVDVLAEAEGDVDPEVAVLGPGFEQQHTVLRIGAEPVGQHAPGRSGTDDDVVVVHPTHR
jgi:hypothetical protein